MAHSVKENQPVGFRLADLAGSIPPKHRPYRDPKSGKSAVYCGQVWVSRRNDELWEVILRPSPQVVLRLYGGYWATRAACLPADLPRFFWTLEDALAIRRTELVELQERYRRGWVNREAFPTFESLAAYLGIDPETGCRVD